MFITIVKCLGTISLILSALHSLKLPAARTRRIRVAQYAGATITSRAKVDLRNKAIKADLTRIFLWFLLLYCERASMAMSLIQWIPFQGHIRLLFWIYALTSIKFASTRPYLRSISTLVKPYESTLDFVFSLLDSNVLLVLQTATLFCLPFQTALTYLSPFFSSSSSEDRVPTNLNAASEKVSRRKHSRESVQPVFPGYVSFTPAARVKREVQKKSAEALSSKFSMPVAPFKHVEQTSDQGSPLNFPGFSVRTDESGLEVPSLSHQAILQGDVPTVSTFSQTSQKRANSGSIEENDAAGLKKARTKQSSLPFRRPPWDPSLGNRLPIRGNDITHEHRRTASQLDAKRKRSNSDLQDQPHRQKRRIVSADLQGLSTKESTRSRLPIRVPSTIGRKQDK